MAIANVARINVPIFQHKLSRRGEDREGNIFSLAVCMYAIVSPEVFCAPKNAPNSFSAGAPPQTPKSAGVGDNPSPLLTPLGAFMWRLVLGAYGAWTFLPPPPGKMSACADGLS